MDEKITIYRPDNSLQRGLPAAFADIFVEITSSRWLIYQLFKRDFLATYKQSLMGVLWAFIIPFAGVVTIVLLSNSGVLDLGDMNVPYPIYALLGLTFWQLFATGLVAASNSLVTAGPMLLKINFSKKSLVLAGLAQASVPFAMQLVLLAVLFAVYGRVPSSAALFLPLLVIPLVLLTVGLGFILALLNGVIRDTGNVVAILLTFLMLLTPVLYARPATGILARITDFNPLYYLVAVPRDLILSGQLLELRGFSLAAGLSLVTFIVCTLLFHLTESRVTERL